MPSMPTFNVTNEQAQRIKEAFDPSLTQEQVADILRDLYKQAVVEKVLNTEGHARVQAFKVQERTRRADTLAEFGVAGT